MTSKPPWPLQGDNVNLKIVGDYSPRLDLYKHSKTIAYLRAEKRPPITMNPPNHRLVTPARRISLATRRTSACIWRYLIAASFGSSIEEEYGWRARKLM